MHQTSATFYIVLIFRDAPSLGRYAVFPLLLAPLKACRVVERETHAVSEKETKYCTSLYSGVESWFWKEARYQPSSRAKRPMVHQSTTQHSPLAPHTANEDQELTEPPSSPSVHAVGEMLYRLFYARPKTLQHHQRPPTKTTRKSGSQGGRWQPRRGASSSPLHICEQLERHGPARGLLFAGGTATSARVRAVLEGYTEKHSGSCGQKKTTGEHRSKYDDSTHAWARPTSC